MGRQCTVCNHKSLEEINNQLLDNPEYRKIALKFHLSEWALRRHKESHIPKALAKSQEAQEMAQANRLLEDLKTVRKRTEGLLDKAEKAGEIRAWPGFLRELREQIKLMAELEGKLAANPPQINITLNAEWIELRTIMLTALDPFPEAKLAVANALHEK